MSPELHEDIEVLKKKILDIASVVQESISLSIKALVNRDEDLATRVIEGDVRIDNTEVEFEENCLRVLGEHHPGAGDLRFVIGMLKMNGELERMGDLAVNIAERAQYLATHPQVSVPVDFEGMTEKVQGMVRMSIEALINGDADKARDVCAMDDEVDALTREMFIESQNDVVRSPIHVWQHVHIMSVARHLERIADHATNIAEDVVYMVRGEIIRHRAEDYKDLPPKG